MSHAARDRVFEELKAHAPITTLDLALKLRMLPQTLNFHIRMLKRDNLIHIHGFCDERGKTSTRIWGIGNHPDATRPKKFDRREYYFGEGYEVEHIPKEEKLTRVQLEELNERRDRKRREMLLAQTKPFRDEMLFLTAGRAA